MKKVKKYRKYIDFKVCVWYYTVTDKIGHVTDRYLTTTKRRISLWEIKKKPNV